MRDAIDSLGRLAKGAPGGGGWGNIPKGTKGGQRKRVGGKYQYRYPDGSGGWQSSPRKGGKRKAKGKAKSGAGKWTSPEQARARGAAAHAEGIQASAQDREFMARTPFDLKVGGTMPYLDAWSEGWHAANRKANDASPEGRALAADMARTKLENEAWYAEQADFRSTIKGVRHIMVLDAPTGGTKLTPVTEATDFELAKRIAKNQNDAADAIDPLNPSEGEKARIIEAADKLWDSERTYDGSVQWPVKYAAYQELARGIEVADKRFGPKHHVVPPSLRDRVSEMRNVFAKREDDARKRKADKAKGQTKAWGGRDLGSKPTVIRNMKYGGTRYKYDHGIFVDATDEDGLFHVSQAGNPTKKLGYASSLEEAQKLALRSADFSETEKKTKGRRTDAERERSGKSGLRELQEGTGKRMATAVKQIAGVESSTALTHDDGTQELSLTVDKTLPQGTIDNIMNAVAATLVGSKSDITVRQGSGTERGRIDVFVPPSKAAAAIDAGKGKGRWPKGTKVKSPEERGADRAKGRRSDAELAENKRRNVRTRAESGYRSSTDAELAETVRRNKEKSGGMKGADPLEAWRKKKAEMDAKKSADAIEGLEVLLKGVQRGGKYYKRVPKAGGKGYKYYYTKEQYDKRPGATKDTDPNARAKTQKIVDLYHDHHLNQWNDNAAEKLKAFTDVPKEDIEAAVSWAKEHGDAKIQRAIESAKNAHFDAIHLKPAHDKQREEAKAKHAAIDISPDSYRGQKFNIKGQNNPTWDQIQSASGLGKAVQQLFPGHSKSDHYGAAGKHRDAYRDKMSEWRELKHAAEVKAYGKKLGVGEGANISGGVDPKFGKETNDKIRAAVHTAHFHDDAAQGHTHAAKYMRHKKSGDAIDGLESLRKASGGGWHSAPGSKKGRQRTRGAGGKWIYRDAPGAGGGKVKRGSDARSVLGGGWAVGVIEGLPKDLKDFTEAVEAGNDEISIDGMARAIKNKLDNADVRSSQKIAHAMRGDIPDGLLSMRTAPTQMKRTIASEKSKMAERSRLNVQVRKFALAALDKIDRSKEVSFDKSGDAIEGLEGLRKARYYDMDYGSGKMTAKYAGARWPEKESAFMGKSKGDIIQKLIAKMKSGDITQELIGKMKAAGVADDVVQQLIGRCNTRKARKSHFEPSLKKGLYAFELSGPESKGRKLSDNLLPQYLGAFVEQAYEHEKQECEHVKNKPTGYDDQLNFFAMRIMNELVVYMRNNPDLMAAGKDATAVSIANILRNSGLIQPDVSGFDNDAGNGYRGEVAHYSKEAPWIQEDPGARPSAQLADHHEQGSFIDDTEDPSIALRKSQVAETRRAFTAPEPEFVVKGDGDCPVHGYHDLTKMQTLLIPPGHCTCN